MKVFTVIMVGIYTDEDGKLKSSDSFLASFSSAQYAKKYCQDAQTDKLEWKSRQEMAPTVGGSNEPVAFISSKFDVDGTDCTYYVIYETIMDYNPETGEHVDEDKYT